MTFVDAAKVRSSNPGCCYRKAGWTRIGATQGGLMAFGLAVEAMPEAEEPLGMQHRLFDVKDTE